MKLTSEIVHGFSNSLLASGFDDAAPTPACHLEWWDLCCSDAKRVAIAAPRGHAKSTAITKAYGLAAVLFRAHDYVLIISDTYQQAVLFLGELKRELDNNEPLREIFQIKDYEMNREDDIIVNVGDDHKFRITALGSEQKARGRLWDGKRPNLVLGDDMENDEIVMNPDRRDKFKKWFLNALLPAMSKHGKVRIVGTILHMDSLLEGFMPKDISPNSIQEDLRVVMRKPVNGWFGVRYAGHGPDASFRKILWPIKWTEEMFKEIQTMYESHGNPEGYYQEYLNKPIDPHHAFFKKSDFIPFSKTERRNDYDLPFSHYPTYLSVDLAVSTKERRDFSVFTVASTDEQGTLYIRKVIRDRLDTKEIVDTIARLKDRYGFNVMLIGKGALEKAIGPYLRDEIHKMNKFLHLEAISEVVDKRMKATSIRGRMRAGGVRFDKEAEWYLEFEQEMLQFDRGAHDDQVDTMALLGLYLDQVQTAPSYKEIEEEEWNDENRTSLEEALNQGRSEITGY